MHEKIQYENFLWENSDQFLLFIWMIKSSDYDAFTLDWSMELQFNCVYLLYVYLVSPKFLLFWELILAIH